MRMCLLFSVFSLLMAPSLAAQNLDQRLLDSIHHRWQSERMDRFMAGISEIGDRETGLIVCLGLSAFGDKKGKETGKLCTVSLLGGQCVSAVLKLVVNRERPDGEPGRMNSSFPSGHVVGAFSVVYVLGNQYPRLKIPSYILAGLVAISRVYLERHWPSDVLAGAVIGCSAGYFVVRKREVVLNFHL